MAEKAFLCGVAEGFYGRPWSASQRRQLFAWMKSWGLNIYLYAPKDDLKHRLLWRELYSPDEAGELKSLIQDGRSKGLQFVCAIAPGLDLAYSSGRDVARLQRKANQLLSLGCRHFAITFDDIQPVLSEEDSRRFNSIAAAQSAVSNGFLKYLRDQTPDPILFFCPTYYCERMSGPVRQSDYLKQVGRFLDSSIQIFWTGPEIVSASITVASIRELQGVLRRKPVLWDNLHANDYDLRRLYLGPYSGRPLELRDEVAGILSNPNCQFEANYVPLRTLAMFAQAKDNWHPRQAYQTALKDWLLQWKTQPARPIAALELEFLCDCLHLPYQHGPRAEQFLDDFQFLLRRPPRNWGRIGRACEKSSAEIIALFDKMTALKNRELLYALYRHAWELKEELVLVGKYLNWLKSGPEPGQTYATPERRQKICRGGLVADLQRLLPMDDKGRFRDQHRRDADEVSNDPRGF